MALLSSNQIACSFEVDSDWLNLSWSHQRQQWKKAKCVFNLCLRGI